MPDPEQLAAELAEIERQLARVRSEIATLRAQRRRKRFRIITGDADRDSAQWWRDHPAAGLAVILAAVLMWWTASTANGEPLPSPTADADHVLIQNRSPSAARRCASRARSSAADAA